MGGSVEQVRFHGLTENLPIGFRHRQNCVGLHTVLYTFTQPRVPPQDVDGGQGLLVLVGGLAPGEVVRGQRVGGDEDLDGGADRLEGVGVGHVQLGAAAEVAGMLLEGGFEVAGTETDAGEPGFGKPCRQPRRIQPGAPKISKGRVVPRPSERLVPSSSTMPG